jgi:tetratricopeptide (TPR) repeat protein
VLYRRSLAIAEQVGSPRAAATALVGLGNLLRLRDDYDGARTRLSQALVLARTTDGAPLLPEVLAHLGHVHRQFGSFAAAEECLTEAIKLTEHDGHHQVQLDALINLGYIRLAIGHGDQATDAFARALDLAREDRHLVGEASAQLGLGHVLLRRSLPARAAALFREVEALAERLDSDNWRFEAALGHARAAQEDDPVAAAEMAGQALAIARALEQHTDVVRAHDVLAGALARTSNRSSAAEHWDCALQLLGDLGLDVLEDGTSVSSISQQRALLAGP